MFVDITNCFRWNKITSLLSNFANSGASLHDSKHIIFSIFLSCLPYSISNRSIANASAADFDSPLLFLCVYVPVHV